MTRAALSFAVRLFRVLRSQRSVDPMADVEENWVDDGSGEREGWSGHHMRELSPHEAWAHGDMTAQPASDVAPTPGAAVARPAAAERVVFDVSWVRLRQGGRHRAGAR